MRSSLEDSVQLERWSRESRSDKAMERNLWQCEEAFIRFVLKDAVQPYWLLDACSGDGWPAMGLRYRQSVGMAGSPFLGTATVLR
jgi:hypothetical protein